MCIRRRGGQLGVTGALLNFHPPSWPYYCNKKNEKLEGRHQGTLERFGRRVLRSGAKRNATVWHSTKRVMESERKMQCYWETVAKVLPIGSEEMERANRLLWDSYWRRVEVWEVLKKNTRKWNHQN